MNTYQEILDDYIKVYKRPRIDIEEVVSFVVGCTKQSLHSLPVAHIKNSLKHITALLDRIAMGEPLEYVLGYKDFYFLRLNVNPHVLIPRHETELLVDKIVNKSKNRNINTIFDVCCGSGAIGLSLKSVNKDARVVLSDISSEAIKLAKENASLNELDVTFLQGDLLLPFKDIKADLIVCNPPYISEAAYNGLSSSVRDYEPKLALYAQNDGFSFYERLSVELPQYLQKGALIAFEIGFDQKENLKDIFSKKPYYKLTFQKDFAGLDRFFFLEIE